MKRERSIWDFGLQSRRDGRLHPTVYGGSLLWRSQILIQPLQRFFLDVDTRQEVATVVQHVALVPIRRNMGSCELWTDRSGRVASALWTMPMPSAPYAGMRRL